MIPSAKFVGSESRFRRAMNPGARKSGDFKYVLSLLLGDISQCICALLCSACYTSLVLDEGDSVRCGRNQIDHTYSLLNLNA